MTILSQPRSSPPGRLPTAEEVQQFSIAAVVMIEHLLASDPLEDPSRPDLTALLCDIQRDPLNVFLEYRRSHPEMIRGLVLAGKLEQDRRTADLALEVMA